MPADDKKPDDKFVHIRITTTSGDCPPPPDFHKVPVHQPVKVLLDKCQKELGLASTEGWLLRKGQTLIDPTRNWESQGFAGGEHVLDWGPDAGGGGHA
jgi:hypothetical protein